MKVFYLKSILFWFVLLILALINATIRELVYKPILEPHIGIWAHQISSLTAIIIFFVAIYFFLKRISDKYSKKDVLAVGTMWFVLTIIFETSLNIWVRKLNVSETLQTYFFWNGETWIFVLISLVLSPLRANFLLRLDAK